MEIGSDARRENDQLIEYSNFQEGEKRWNWIYEKIERDLGYETYVSLFETKTPILGVFKIFL
jgi:hypothetical protein